MQWLTCAGHSYDIARFADHVIHDSHDTELIPCLLLEEGNREINIQKVNHSHLVSHSGTFHQFYTQRSVSTKHMPPNQ